MNTLSNFSKYQPIARNTIIGVFLLATLTMLRNLGIFDLSDTQFASVEAWLYALVDLVIVLYLIWNANKNVTANARVDDVVSENVASKLETIMAEIDNPEFAERVKAELANES